MVSRAGSSSIERSLEFWVSIIGELCGDDRSLACKKQQLSMAGKVSYLVWREQWAAVCCWL